MLAALAAVRLSEALHAGRRRKASDVHLHCGSPPVFRIDGHLEPMDASTVAADEVEEIAKVILGDAGRQQLADGGDVTALYADPAGGRVRVHAYRTASGVSLALRLLALSVPPLETLRVPDAVTAFCELSRGLVLVTGPTGSGKTTLLASMLDRINRAQSRHIVTIENPIEYEHVPLRSLISQRQIGVDTPTCVDAIYGALRSDPDVIVIGEIRDPETMHAALTAAETGHLVMATLHTGDAAQTVDRIIGAFGPESQQQVRIQLAQTLAGVICMRLIPRAGGEGRICAAEILASTDAVRNLIRDGKTHQIKNVIATNRHLGMQTLEMHVADLVARGEISTGCAKATLV